MIQNAFTKNDFPKMDIRGGMQIIPENWVVCQKEEKIINGGVVGKCKNLFCKNQNKKNLLIKKNMYNVSIFQISELCKSCKIFLINKVLKVVP